VLKLWFLLRKLLVEEELLQLKLLLPTSNVDLIWWNQSKLLDHLSGLLEPNLLFQNTSPQNYSTNSKDKKIRLESVSNKWFFLDVKILILESVFMLDPTILTPLSEKFLTKLFLIITVTRKKINTSVEWIIPNLIAHLSAQRMLPWSRVLESELEETWLSSHLVQVYPKNKETKLRLTSPKLANLSLESLKVLTTH